jgi:hypothetical protein
MGKMKPAPKSALRRLKEIRVDWEMFNFHIHCVIGPHEDLEGYIKFRQGSGYSAPPAVDCVGLYFYALPKKGGILWLRHKPRSPAQIGYLAHEVGHAVMDLTRTRGFRPNCKTEETICYAIAHGVEAILKGAREA